MTLAFNELLAKEHGRDNSHLPVEWQEMVAKNAVLPGIQAALLILNRDGIRPLRGEAFGPVVPFKPFEGGSDEEKASLVAFEVVAEFSQDGGFDSVWVVLEGAGHVVAHLALADVIPLPG